MQQFGFEYLTQPDIQVPSLEKAGPVELKVIQITNMIYLFRLNILYVLSGCMSGPKKIDFTFAILSLMLQYMP